MALDPRKRQKKLERRKAKDRSRAIAERKQLQKAAAKELNEVYSSPLLPCHVHSDIWEQGMGQVMICRQLPHNRVAYANFLVDVFCLGVKGAYFHIVSTNTYESEVLVPMKERFALEKIAPACARKLVEGAVAFARSFGISPHSDYAMASLIFGEIDASLCTHEFTYGKQGKPLYISGPHDTPAKSARIVSLLQEHLGPDEYHAVIAGAMGRLQMSEFMDDDEEFDSDDDFEVIDIPARPADDSR